MTSHQLRQKYLDFFVSKGHKIIPAAPLVLEKDPTTLFTSSGMQPLVPYLLGKSHPEGKRLVNVQPSLRVADIEEIGDRYHTTFFEMLGNWSLGDYFKKEQLNWIWEFLTKEIRLPEEKLYVTIFDGDKRFKIYQNSKRQSLTPDVETKAIWTEIGVPENRIYFYGAEKNWWSRWGSPENMPVGDIGGPDSEIFYDFGKELHLHENSLFKNEKCHPNCECGRFLEIGNSVFMQYKKINDRTFEELPNKNVDFGGGLERIAAAIENNPDIFKIDLFWPIIQKIEELTHQRYQEHPKEFRIITDHLKASVFLIHDGIRPSNKLQGYILRRLLRRSAVKMFQLDKNLVFASNLKDISNIILDIYEGCYGINKNQDQKIIAEVLIQEMERFSKILNQGLKETEKLTNVTGKVAFDLYQTYGFPLELTEELLAEKGQKVNKDEFEKEFEKHKELSRTASAGMFKGGLADQSEKVVKFHTATHLLHAALRQILGPHVQQKGSNITAERLRFDFSHLSKLTPEQTKEVEDLVNSKIKENLPVKSEAMSKEEALKSGALGFFGEKYGDKVTVYAINSFSKEICGGPHVSLTGTLGHFKILKEESAGANIRRIYADLT